MRSTLGDPAPARRLRRRHRGRRGPAARQPARLRRPVVRLLRRHAGALHPRMPGRIAGETRDVDGRRGFVLDTPDPRAAHPPREGDLEHLHEPGAERARRSGLPGWLGRQGVVELGELMARAPPTPASASARSRESSCCTSSRSCASSRSGSSRAGRRGDRGLRRGRESTPATPLGADYAEFADGLLVAITERRTREHIDRLADVLGKAVAGGEIRARAAETVPA